MASQIALLFAQKLQVPIIIKDIKQDFIDKGVAYIRDELAKQVKKGKLSNTEAKWMGNDLITGTVSYSGFEDCDIVIEAVFEAMSIKQTVFKELEEVCKPETLFLTNTSSLNITEMAKNLRDPSRVIGFHFFNPIAVLPLVEIIRADKTGETALAAAFDLAKKIKKTPVLVKNSPGFLVNRILLSMTDAVMNCVDQGASFMQVDSAVLDMGFPMAPFALMGLVGPAVLLHVQKTLNMAWQDRFAVSKGLESLVEKKKSGVYLMQDGKPVSDPDIKDIWIQGNKSFTDEIKDTVLTRMTQEIDLILKEGVVASPKDLDTAMILGAGYPFFMGGITLYLDQKGYAKKITGRRFHGMDMFDD